jgi:hypothetical protein
MKTIDITNDYRINRALGAAVEIAAAVGEGLLVSVVVLAGAAGFEDLSLRGLVWGTAGVLIAVAVVVSWIL